MMQKYQDSSLSPEERASDLLARMDLDEKFGQIQCYNAIDSFLCSISAVTRALVVWEKPTVRTRPLPLRWGQPM